MSVTSITTLLIYMIICSFTPGPGNILALNTTSRYGWNKSKRLILGICVGYGVVQAICTITIYELNQVFNSILELLRYIGGIYMVFLAIKIMRSKLEDEEKTDKQPTFREGFLLQLVNVKIYFYITSLLSIYFIPNINSIIGLVLAGIFAVSIGSIASLTWAFLGVKLEKIYRKHFRIINIVLGLFLIYCAYSIVRRM
ncbi:LysE family transporter [Clostridium sp. MSJ-8]|uniref:LysE family transporter n=1 Tax=Clostridium sp. MSJ-8 TaxID=2841510 RepID=UPI001C0EC965|nr:LysE family transporter [Clostridium sp. MSJ-8]MBU5487513.1 LysE family transporter [Clostridium sp. MSJ-8]